MLPSTYLLCPGGLFKQCNGPKTSISLQIGSLKLSADFTVRNFRFISVKSDSVTDLSYKNKEIKKKTFFVTTTLITGITMPGVDAFLFFKLHCDVLRDFEKNERQPNGERFASPRLRIPKTKNTQKQTFFVII